jgi:hypothetical protein
MVYQNSNDMNLKDDMLHLLGSTAMITETEEGQILNNYTRIDGLCPLCENRPHCVWVEHTKLYCEHYE